MTTLEEQITAKRTELDQARTAAERHWNTPAGNSRQRGKQHAIRVDSHVKRCAANHRLLARLERELAALERRAAPAPPASDSIAAADLYRYHKVVHRLTGGVFEVLGGDVRYETTGSGLGDYRAASTGTGVLLRSAVPTHPWGWVADLADLAPLPDGDGMYHSDHLRQHAGDLERTYSGSWREAAANAARPEPYLCGWRADTVLEPTGEPR